MYPAQPVVALQESDSGMPDISVIQLTWTTHFLHENSWFLNVDNQFILKEHYGNWTKHICRLFSEGRASIFSSFDAWASYDMAFKKQMEDFEFLVDDSVYSEMFTRTDKKN